MTTTKAFTYPFDNKNTYAPKQNCNPPKKIGFGSYGQVFEANNPLHVVKKVDKYANNDKYVKSFDLYSITEIVVLKKTMFANIPKIHGVSLSTDKIMIEMDNCGKTLYDMSRRLTFEQRCCVLPWIAYQLIKTAFQLQVNGIIHNDIKSGNVVVNDELVVSLIDFGLCVFENVQNTNSKKTTPNVGVSNSWGTYCICPPEMFINGHWIVDKIMPWSIGITLCEFLYSTHNFLRDYIFNDKEKKMYTLYSRYDSMLKSMMNSAFSSRIAGGNHSITLNQNIPYAINELVQKLLTFNPHNRASLVDVLQLPIFAEYTGANYVNTYIDPCIYYHQVGEPLLQQVESNTYRDYRRKAIEWMYSMFNSYSKLYLFIHAVSIFDRVLNKIYIDGTDYIAVACAASYIAQYIQKTNALRFIYIVDASCNVVKSFDRPHISYQEAEKYVELVLTLLDYDLYYRTIDILLADQNLNVKYDVICDVMTSTVPPYNNMILLRNYKKILEEIANA